MTRIAPEDLEGLTMLAGLPGGAVGVLDEGRVDDPTGDLLVAEIAEQPALQKVILEADRVGLAEGQRPPERPFVREAAEVLRPTDEILEMQARRQQPQDALLHREPADP